MKISLWNGNPDAGNAVFETHLVQFSKSLQNAGHFVNTLVLRGMKINHCIGCFQCWVKTPGICVFPDDHKMAIIDMLSCDFLIFASPLSMGFPTSLLKKTLDRSLPVLLPYIDVSTGECRHYHRYDESPMFGLLYQPENDTDAEDVQICTRLFSRFARNARTTLAFVRAIEDPLEEVCREVNRI